MADWPPKKNATFTVTFPIYDNDGDLVTAAAALDSEVSKDGGTFTDCTNEAGEIATSSGLYTLALTATEMNADIVATITKTSTTDAKTAVNVMYTATRQLVDLAFPTTSGRSIDTTATGAVGVDFDNVEGTLDAAEIGTGAITAAKFAAGAIDAAAIANGAIDAATFAAGAIDAAAIANAAIDAATFAAGAIDAAAIAADAITAAKIANGAIDAATFAAGAIDAAAIATGAIDADALAADAVTEIRALETGTSDAGGSTTTMVDAARTEADDVHIGKWIMFTSGAVANQVRLITDFVAATDTTTFAPPTTASIGAGITYEFLPAGAVDVQSWVGLVTGLQTPNALQSGRVDSYVGAMAAAVIAAASFAAGAIDAAAIGTGAIDADAIAAAAITAAKFAAGAIDAAAIANGAIDAATFAAGAIDAAAIATGAIDAATFAAGAIDAAAIATGAIDADALAADAANEIADAILSRDVDNVEATAPVHSLCVAILKAVSRIRDNAGTLEVYRTDGLTLKMSQTVTTDAALDPVDELSAGS